jgi:hypothetical protein
MINYCTNPSISKEYLSNKCSYFCSNHFSSNIQIYLSNIKIEDFIVTLPKNKLIVLKLPFNYNIDFFKDYIIKKLLINNILIIFIKIC